MRTEAVKSLKFTFFAASGGEAVLVPLPVIHAPAEPPWGLAPLGIDALDDEMVLHHMQPVLLQTLRGDSGSEHLG